MNRLYIPVIAVALIVVGVGTLEFLNSGETESNSKLETNDNPHYNSIDQKIQKLATSPWNKDKLLEIEADLHSKQSLGLIKQETAKNLKSYLYGEYMRVLSTEANKRVANATSIGDISAVHAELRRMDGFAEYRNSVSAPLSRCNALISYANLKPRIASYIKNEQYDRYKSKSFFTSLDNGSVNSSIRNSPLVSNSYSVLKKDLTDFEEFQRVFMTAYENGDLLDCPDLIDYCKKNCDYPNKNMYYLRTYTSCR